MSMQGISSEMLRTLQRISDIESRLQQFDGTAAPTQESSTAASFADMVDQSVTSDKNIPPFTPTSENAPATTSDIDTYISEAAKEYQIRPALLRAVIQTESSFNPHAVSPAGAQGLMQLMPSTASALGVTDPFDARQNIMGGTKYLRQQLDRFGGDEQKALAAYNAGAGAVVRYGGVPPYPETMHYVSKILSLAGNQD